MSQLELAFDTIPIKTKATWKTWCVQLSISEEAKESMQYKELKEVNGTFVMRFPCDPLQGDIVNYKGHAWRVDYRVLEPTRYNSKEQKMTPTIVCSYLQRLN